MIEATTLPRPYSLTGFRGKRLAGRKQRILRAMEKRDGPVSARDVAAECNLTAGEAARALRHLRIDGRVRIVADPRGRHSDEFALVMRYALVLEGGEA
jgi:predicted ArsR family transcriptional regulator